MSMRNWLLDRFFATQVDQRVQAALKVIDDKYWRSITPGQLTSRSWMEVQELLQQVETTCDKNPLATRLLQMTTEFVIGSWIQFKGDPWVAKFWHDPMNDLDRRVYVWCHELAKTGELFLVLSRNAVSKMSYVRELPAILIDEIRTDLNDMEIETEYHQLTADTEGKWWPAAKVAPIEVDQVMLHFAINRDVGQVRGRSDLATYLTWLDRYDTWLEDRVRINRYKGAYVWQVKIEGALPGQLEAKRAQYSRIPTPGSIIVTDGHETWTAVQPNISAEAVQADGRALRLMIAAGAAVPLHFLAEGEATTLATAKEMGTPSFRHWAHRQYVLGEIIEEIIQIAGTRAGEKVGDVEITFESVLTELEAQPGAGPEQPAEPRGVRARPKATPAPQAQRKVKVAGGDGHV